MWIKKIQISVLGINWIFKLTEFPLCSQSRTVGLCQLEPRRRGRSCSLVHRGFKGVALGNSCCMEYLSA